MLATSLSAAVTPVIRPENRLNAVLVRDVATRMGMYEQLIRTLDTPQKLVEIEVTTLTPLDALNTLYRLQNKLKNRW